MSALGDPDVDVVGGSSPLRESKASRILEKTMREVNKYLDLTACVHSQATRLI